MTTMNRLNTTISDHMAVANYIALCLLVSGAIVGTVALRQNGDLATSYDALFPTTAVAEAPTNVTQATKAQVAPQTSTTELSVSNSTPRSVQIQSQNMVNELQPANDITYLLPSANNSQLTGAVQQNAEGTNLQ